jgi:hypothetical protein
MSRLGGKLARLEAAFHLKRGESKGSIEFHYPGGAPDPSGHLLPCDKRDEHGPDCVMSVNPTNSGVRFMRIIHGDYQPETDNGPDQHTPESA